MEVSVLTLERPPLGRVPVLVEDYIVHGDVAARHQGTAQENTLHIFPPPTANVAEGNITEETRVVAIRRFAGERAVVSEDGDGCEYIIKNNILIQDVVHTTRRVGVGLDTNTPGRILALRVEGPGEGGHVAEGDVRNGPVPHPADCDPVSPYASDIVDPHVTSTAYFEVGGLGLARPGKLADGNDADTVVTVVHVTVSEGLVMTPVEVNTVRVGGVVGGADADVVDANPGAVVNFDVVVRRVLQVHTVNTNINRVADNHKVRAEVAGSEAPAQPPPPCGLMGRVADLTTPRDTKTAEGDGVGDHVEPVADVVVGLGQHEETTTDFESNIGGVYADRSRAVGFGEDDTAGVLLPRAGTDSRLHRGPVVGLSVPLRPKLLGGGCVKRRGGQHRIAQQQHPQHHIANTTKAPRYCCGDKKVQK
eukprot:Hpha_TRINITY_DN10544_c0_g1::TRINITY_DN10544_c0_g1_i1::g.31262::m.31262